jgi:glycosyltransferase involved in cell wall biosynthesis
VGYWAWEQSLAPEAWRPSFRYVDAVWLPSTFAADAMARIAPPEVPLVVIPHPVAVGEITADRGRFNLPEDQCLVLCAFDLKSTAARKNPWGALEAFKRASPAPGSATLVCKVSGSAAEPELFARLAAAVLRRADVRLIDEALSEEDMTRLIASVDIVLSPHRAEGFGLVLAEAMLLGKAVVATGWSGNMDFMTAETGALIRYELTPAVDPQGMYDARSSWADPDLDHAALLLKTLIEDADGRQALGRRARLHAEHVFDRKRWAARVRQALYGASLPPP